MDSHLNVTVCYILCVLVFIAQVFAQDPSWSVEPQNGQGDVGKTVILQCGVNNLAPKQVTWSSSKRNTLFVSEARYVNDVRFELDTNPSVGKFNLIITNLTKEDFDDYTCQVQLSISKTVQLEVFAPPDNAVLAPVSQKTEGDSVAFTCSSSGGYPPPTITITKNGQVVPGSVSTTPPPTDYFGTSTQSVTVKLDYTDDKANYSCTANNNKKPQATDSQVLDVLYKPRVSVSPNTLNVVLGNQAVLTCDVSANPEVSTVTWSKSSVGLPETSKTLTISNTVKSSGGQYTCQATNSIGTQEGTGSLVIQYAPEITCTTPVTANQGQTATLTCIVVGVPSPTSTWWTFNGNIVGGPGSTLSLPNVDSSKAGTYTIRSQNTLTPTLGSGSLGDSSKDVVLEVNYPPGEARIGSIPTYFVGDTAQLNCTVSDPGKPVAQYKWSKDGTLVSGATSSSLKITQVNLTDGGAYTCTPYNSLGDGTPDTETLTINDKPTFLADLQTNGEVSIKTVDFSIRCEVRGKPEVNITWYKGDVQLQQGPLYTIETAVNDYQTYSKNVTSTLKFSGSGRPTNSLRVLDTGFYQCKAVSSVATPISSTTMNLRIKYPPAISSDKDKIAVDINKTATINCMAHSYPIPTFTWKKNTQDITDALDGFSIATTTVAGHAYPYRSTLTIANVSMDNLGDYECKASNEEGDATKMLSLTGLDKPDAPVNLVVSSITWDQVTLKWEPGFDGGYPQTYTIAYRHSGLPEQDVDIKSDSGTEFSVTGLYPSKNYTFRVYGINILGGGPYSNEVSAFTEKLDIVSPVLPVYHPGNGTITFTTTEKGRCLKVESSSDTTSWKTIFPCVPIVEGENSVSVTSGSPATFRLSICLSDRKDVCSPAVHSKRVDVMDPNVIYIAVGVCGGVVLLLVIVLLICCIRRRQSRKEKNYENEPVNRRTQPVLETANTRQPQSYDNAGIDLDDPTAEGVFGRHDDSMNGYSNYVMLERNAKPNGHAGNGHAPHMPPFTPYPNGKVKLQESSPDNSLDSTAYDKQNIINEDEFNHRGVDESDYPYIGSRPPSQPYHHHNPYNPYDPYNKFDGSRSGIESGYSTPDPTKPKKVIYEVIV